MKPLFILLLISVSQTAFAENVKCQVDQPVENGRKMPVPVTVSSGAQIVEAQPVSFAGHTFSAHWAQPSREDSQGWFKMNFDGHSSIMYDFTTKGHHGPINVIYFENLRFQCWVE